MKIELREKGGISVFDLRGDVIGSWALELKQRLTEAKRRRLKYLVLNFKDVNSIDSLGVEAILGAIKKGIEIRIVFPNPSCRNMFEKYDLLRLVKVSQGEEDALKSFSVYRDGFTVNRRRHARVQCNIPVEITLKNTRLPGVLLNISEGGGLLGYLDPFGLDKNGLPSGSLQIAIRLAKESEPIRVEGEIKSFDRSREIMAMGIEFTGLSDEYQTIIKSYCSPT